MSLKWFKNYGIIARLPNIVIATPGGGTRPINGYNIGMRLE